MSPDDTCEARINNVFAHFNIYILEIYCLLNAYMQEENFLVTSKNVQVWLKKVNLGTFLLFDLCKSDLKTENISSYIVEK